MITPDQFDDALAELVNVGVGRAAAALSAMVNERIELSVPQVMSIQSSELSAHLDLDQLDHLSLVQLCFGGKVGGSASILFPVDSARRLVGLLTGGELSAEELDLEREAALTEVGNILINGVMGTIGNMTGVEVFYQLPEYAECSMEELGSSFHNRDLLLAMVVIAISGQEIKGHLVLVFDLPSIEHLNKVIEQMSGNV